MLPRVSLSRVVSLARSASSQARGRQSILQKKPDDVVITFAQRTAVGKVRKGQLKDSPVDEILLALFKATLAKTKLDPVQIDDICVGTCHPPSPLYVSRAAAMAAGIPAEVPISTVNRLCSSGLMSVRNIAHHIQAGEASLGIAVGVESMSLNPRPTPEICDDLQLRTCLQLSELLIQAYYSSLQTQETLGPVSGSEAQKAGIFKDKIIPIEIGGKQIHEDDTIRPGVTAESLAGLKPVFPDWGSGVTTAGNASGIGDGAALCILTTRERAEKEGMEILGKWVASSVVGVEPRYMGIAPIPAIEKLLKQTDLKKEDVDTWEINEAFASQFAYCVEQLGIPIEKINVNGGAIALTHPLGMTGARQIVTGLAQLRRQNGQILCTSMCIGSGMGAAAIFVNEAR
ncbi:thiolase [Fomitiporia mediterranea MF3/22]|uniref:thiolase n=1 Tax=Fomitiporia mediterranea (strain MF3/22) TaxID=694068 RepID=UPI0004408AE1|nr:thiolase [Fomitiporia mediterranea MF3/22]EJD03926.1 thiolase [Fomitiporia mediterranea MF3/22]